MMTYEDNLSFKSALEDAILALSGDLSMQEGFLKESFSGDQYDLVIDHLKKEKINILSKEDVLFSLKKLAVNIGQTKPVDLIIAVEPDEKFKKSVFDWFSKNVSMPVLPRYKIEPDYVGGAKITFKGNFLDLSLRNKLDELPIFKRKI